MSETFNRYLGEVREHLIKELRNSFANHPRYRKTIPENIFRASPYIHPAGHRRVYPSESIVVTGGSNSMQRLSPDNFVGNLWSFINKIDYIENKPGLFLDWLKEDTDTIARKFEEDVTATRDRNTIKLTKLPIINERNTDVTYNPNHIYVFLGQKRIFPTKLNGRTGEVEFDFLLPSQGKITASYFHRNLEAPGLYRIEITDTFFEDQRVQPKEQEDFEFFIDPIAKCDQLLTKNLQQTTTFQLKCPVLETNQGNGVKGFALEVFRDLVQRLTPGLHYTYNPETAEITMLVPPTNPGAEITARYRSLGQERGPFRQRRNTYNNQALQGVILAFGNQIEKGDKAFVEVFDTRELVANVYGALWNFTLDITIFAKDTNTSIELAKLTHQYLEMDIRPAFSFAGIELEEISLGGEGTETHLDVTQDPYFTATLSLTGKSFWERRYPIYGCFTEVFPNAFYILDPTREYYYVERPEGIPGSSKIPIVLEESRVHRDYPTFSGKFREPEFEEPKRTPNNPIPGKPAPDIVNGFF